MTKSIAYFKSGQLRQAVWRWHFYAGLFVIPFLLMLSLSGMLMLISKPIESLRYQELATVKPEEKLLPASTLLAIVHEQYPEMEVQLYIPPREISESARFSLVATSSATHFNHDRSSTTVYLNPYNGDILGTLDPSITLYARLKTFHGTLFLGSIGDNLIEAAAGLAVLMILSGLYLTWPREGWRIKVPRLAWGKRESWRFLHRLIGFLVAVPLLIFLLSGLAWTSIWGSKLVQPWSSLPGNRFEDPKAVLTHQSMNQDGIHQVPWVIEQTPLPMPHSDAAMYDLDAVINIAKEQGFVNYRVHLPRSDSNVWTISATTIAGDLKNLLAERTLHIVPSNGQVLADLKFMDYPVLGMAMAAFVPLHQGDLGTWNLVLNLLLIAMVVITIISGAMLWWKRCTASEYKAMSPEASPKAYKVVVVVMLVISFCFPLSAAVLMLAMIADWLLFSTARRLRLFAK